MKQLIVLAALGSLAASAALAHEEHRQLGAHVHGESKLDIAIEGKKISMQLHAPGMDIVGFEHTPSTPSQKSAHAKAVAALAAPLSLFKLSPKAGCAVVEASVKVVAEEEEHEAEHKPADAGKAAEAHEHEEEGHHNEFEASYELACADTAALEEIGFPFFKTFPKADQVDVTIVSDKGQTQAEVKRAAPVLKLRGMI
jgi:hypothetical protein